jgi:leucyl aminopeptidase
MPLTFAPDTASALPLYVVSSDDLEAWLKGQPEVTQAWLATTGFKAGLGQVTLVPGENGAASKAVAGLGALAQFARTRFQLGRVQAALPDGTYKLHNALPAPLVAEDQALGWLLQQYRFDRYKSGKEAGAMLIAPEGVDAARVEVLAAGEALTRDLINTPAADMGPDALEAAARSLADGFGASFKSVVGDALLDQNFPMIHAVGRAAAKAPRRIELNWGARGPALTLVGKGVCFDTGGLNLKPGASMGLMKKDMGGAATVLGLAHMIMALDMPLRLRVLIPAVENNVSGNSFRPGDVLTSRKGLTVEINNTDAEGRLVLADALALADETPADLVISMATLTGAARVAVGPDLAPFYASTAALSDAIRSGGQASADPVW